MEENLRGVLGWKGERGYSAYEIGVKNGFIGTEKDWLAQLGTTLHFSEDSIVHIATANQTSFDIPETYVSGSIIDIYVNGFKLNSNEYTIDIDTRKINLVDITLDEGAVVELVVKVMGTNKITIKHYNSVSNMKLDTTLENANLVHTLGYYEINDGGAADYIIREKTENDVVDNGSIHFLDNGLVAELINYNEVSINQFGAKGDSETDDSQSLINAIKYCVSKKIKLILLPKTYYFENIIDLNDISNMNNDFCLHIDGFNKHVTKLLFKEDLEYGFKYTGTTLKNFIFENLTFETTKADVTSEPANIKMLYLENSPYSIFRNVNIKGCMYGLYQTNCWCSKYYEMNTYYCGYGIYADGYNYTVGYADNLIFEKVNMGQNPVYSGIYLKGCVNVKMLDVDAESSTKGNAITLDSCKNVKIDNFYCEYWLNQNPILIKASDLNSLDRIPSGITINNINAFNTCALVKIEACLSCEINNVFYRNNAYDEEVSSYEEYPLLISMKEVDCKYIGTIKVNGTNYIRPISQTTLPAYFTAYNNLMTVKQNGFNYYKATLVKGTKIYISDDNLLKTIIEDGSYGTNPTSLISFQQNNFYGTLNGSDSNIYVGQYLTINSQKMRVIKIEGLTVVFDTKFNGNGANIPITLCNPKCIDINL